MKRRQFIKRSTVASVPLVLGGSQVSALNNPFFNLLRSDSDRVLVIIQLNGGNDGLAMLTPKDQYDNLMNVRANVTVPENTLLDLSNNLAFHPSMEGLKQVFDDGKLNIIQSAGYPDQNRSHFRSTDIWTSGSPADQFWTTGWLGRYFDTLYAGYPEGYPNAETPDPIAITIGSSVTTTCEGVGGNFSMALVDPENLSALAVPVSGDLPDSCYGDQISFLVDSIVQTNAYNDVIQVANDNGNNLSTKYPDADANALAAKLKIVAKLISGGLQTKVYVVSLGGFDTHAEQVVDGDATQGEHAQLLKMLSDATCAFQDDLKKLGLEERVIGMTFSEFGRRIRSNNSLGTDHGTAAPMMLFGSCVNPIVLGDNPEISTSVDIQEGVPMQYDFRSVYGSVLMDWFEVEEQTVKDLLYDGFQHLPILTPCGVTSTEDLNEELDISVYPNPFDSVSNIEFTTKGGWIKISVFDVIGSEVKILTERKFNEGKHSILLEGHGLPAGSYYVRMQTEEGQKTKRVVKI